MFSCGSLRPDRDDRRPPSGHDGASAGWGVRRLQGGGAAIPGQSAQTLIKACGQTLGRRCQSGVRGPPGRSVTQHGHGIGMERSAARPASAGPRGMGPHATQSWRQMINARPSVQARYMPAGRRWLSGRSVSLRGSQRLAWGARVSLRAPMRTAQVWGVRRIFAAQEDVRQPPAMRKRHGSRMRQHGAAGPPSGGLPRACLPAELVARSGR